jgi:hypothetical protein
VQWKGEGEIRSGHYTMYYSGGERSARRLAIIVHKGELRSVMKKIVCSERIIAVNLKAWMIIDLLVQMYVLTSDYEEEEMEEMYNAFEEVLENGEKVRRSPL